MNIAWFRARWRKVSLLVLAIGLCTLLQPLITPQTRTQLGGVDGRQYATMGYHLWKNQIFSRTLDGQIKVTMHREPVPPVLNAMWLMTRFSPDEVAAPQELFEGPFAVKLKQINLVYAAITLLFVSLIVLQLTGSIALAYVGQILLLLFFLSDGEYVNTAYAEMLAACLMSVLCFSFLQFAKKPSVKNALLSGFLLGLLALTKAAVFYVGIVAVALMVIASQWKALSGKRFSPRVCLIFILSFLLLPSLWIARNYHHFSYASITKKGGNVLWARAVRNKEITGHEILGSFVVYSPLVVRKYMASHPASTPIHYRKGGRWERLSRNANIANDKKAVAEKNPDKAISLYRKAKAWREKLVEEEKSVQKEAIGLILAHPFKHLANTVALAYRGMWSGGSAWFSWGAVWVNFLGMLSFLFLSIFAAFKMRFDLLYMLVVPLGLFSFLALLTHFLPRYSAPIFPVFIVSLCIVLSFLIKKTPGMGRFRG